MKSPLFVVWFFFAMLLPLRADFPRIVCMGDSITQSHVSQNSYRYNLWKKLIDNGVSFDFVGSTNSNYLGSPTWPSYRGKTFDSQHEGHWGWRADEILANLPTWLTSYTPDVALIHLGSNDIIQGQSVSSTINDMAAIISALRGVNPRVVVILAKVIPYSSNYANSHAIQTLNTELALLAQTQNQANSNVVIVDQFNGFSVTADTFDGVHPNASGEEKMATRWASALLPYLNVPPVTIASGTLVQAGQLKPYTTSLVANQGHPPYQWSLESLGGLLPAGLALSSDGELTGTPTVAGEFTVMVRVTDSYHRTHSKALSLRVASALEVWRVEKFATPINAGEAADGFDYDHDGIPNLIEYAFGLDPLNSHSRELPELVNDGTHLKFFFTPPSTVAGIIYAAEWSTSLADDWAPLSSTGTLPAYEFRAAMAGRPSLFMRLRVETAP